MIETSIIDLSGFKNELKSVWKTYIDTGLKYGWKSNRRNDYDYGHWNKVILQNNKAMVYDHYKMPYIEKHPLIKLLWEQILAVLGERSLLRVYVNGYTYGTDAYFHTDDSWINEVYGNDVRTETAIIYLNEEWNKDWGGETAIAADEEIEVSVLPKFGRCLVFDSNKMHSARPLSRACPVLRSVLVFKTIDVSCNSIQVDSIIEYTKNLRHNGKTFFEHLYNVSYYLYKNNCERQVCNAGLFHSIYGTEYYNFEHKDKFTREKVKSLIGVYGEDLVFTFCNLKDRTNSIIENRNNFEESFAHDLRMIEYANLLDQNNISDDRLRLLNIKIKEYNDNKKGLKNAS